MPENAVLRLASVDKLVTHAAIVKAYEDGLLHPDDKIFEILDVEPVPGKSAGARVEQITLEHLRLHKSLISDIGGLQQYQDHVAFQFGITAAELTKEHLARVLYREDTRCVTEDGSLKCAPGSVTNIQYSSNGYFLLRYAIEKALGGQTLEQYLNNNMGASDIVVAFERMAGRHEREPGYRIIGQPLRFRWFELEEYLALSASATGLSSFFTNYAMQYERIGNTFIPRDGGQGGGMDGTRSGASATMRVEYV